jgi:Tfp pilus assembly protein PilE
LRFCDAYFKEGGKVYKKGLVRFLNVLIIIAMIYLVYMIVYPNYKDIQKQNKIEDVKANMHFLKVAVENFAAFNAGRLPSKFEEFKRYIHGEKFPVNPYTLMVMTEDEIINNVYKDPTAFEDDSISGINSKLEGDPGEIFYSTYRSPGDSTFVIHYSIIGMNGEGESITYEDAGQKRHIYILNDQD